MLLHLKSFTYRTYLLLLLLLFSGAGIQATAADYVKVYYPQINKAELLIVQQDYAGALETYQEAFAAVPRPFARDHYNAAVCAMLTDDEKRAIHYLESWWRQG